MLVGLFSSTTKAHQGSLKLWHENNQHLRSGGELWILFYCFIFFVHMFRLDLDPIKCIFILCQSLASLLVLVRLGYVFWVGHNSVVTLVADVNILEVSLLV